MRRFLRETYIGAIATGLLFFYAIQAAIQCIENPFLMWIARKNQPSVLMSQQVQYVNKPLLYRTLGELLLYLFFGVLMIAIVYSGEETPAEKPKAE